MQLMFPESNKLSVLAFNTIGVDFDSCIERKWKKNGD